jgi:hypothetical protein
MQRALQTAIHMFKDHPNKDKITFIALPLVHEYLHTSNDIPADYQEVMKRYAVGEAICEGLKFDFGLIEACGQP